MTNWTPRRGASSSAEAEHEIERRTQQIKEIVRLGAALRAEMGLESIFTQLVESINTTIGFKVAALNIVREQSDYVEVVATAGLSSREREQLTQRPPRLESLLGALQPEFCISHSYFISHHNKALLYSIDGITLPTPAPPLHATDAWHPDDALLVPLISPRDERLLGILSLDQPDDGKIPTLDTIEIIELFASVAALAIDTSRLFQEREQERQGLRDGLFELLFQMEQVRQGNLSMRPQLSGNTLLDPITESLNATLVTLNNVLAEVRGAGEMVSLSAAEMRVAAVALADDAQQQSEQMLGVSQTIEAMARNVRGIAEMADTSDAEAQGASQISHEGRDAAIRAAEGMSRVREMTLQAAKKVKRLGESSQEIGAIVQMVADFTSQTNLLALNAAIEAARAGEHGRGFAIVAQEIRNLATSSAEATRQIHARIQSVQNETSQVVAQIEHTTQQVVLQSEFAAVAGAALEAVDASTQSIAREIERMRALANEQSGAAKEIAQAMAGLASNVTQTRNSMDQTRVSMEYLVDLAVALLRKIGMFHLDIDEIAPTQAYPMDDPLADLLGVPAGMLGPASLPLVSVHPTGQHTRPLLSALPSLPPQAPPAPLVYPSLTPEAPPSASATRAMSGATGASRWPEPSVSATRASQPGQAPHLPNNPPVGWLTPLDPDVDETAKKPATPSLADFRASGTHLTPTLFAAPVTMPIPAVDPFAPVATEAASANVFPAPQTDRADPVATSGISGAPVAESDASVSVSAAATADYQENGSLQARPATDTATDTETETQERAPKATNAPNAGGELAAFEAQETQPMPIVTISALAGEPPDVPRSQRRTSPLPLSALIPPNVSLDESVVETGGDESAPAAHGEAPPHEADR